MVIDAAGGSIEGRTAVQKLCYFAGLALNEDLGHTAHYYGPYSRDVEAALQNESFAGDLDENLRSFSSPPGEGRAYTYGLTEQGQEVVADLRREKADAVERIDKIVRRLGELVPSYKQHPLSLAAKVDLILRQQGEATAAQIPELARGLGWKVSDPEVTQAVEILVGLNRVEQPSAAT
jgi:hypothetical protein